MMGVAPSLTPAPENTTATEPVVTFYVGPLLLGLPIAQVREINRHLDFTPVPHAPPQVRGVVNLRGEVVTVLDLHRVLGLPAAEQTLQTRNLIVFYQGEPVGLLVDQVADIVEVAPEELNPPPANVQGVQARFFRGVLPMERDILVLLDLDEALSLTAEKGGNSRQENTRS